jgi:signal transduction histidine kinase
VREPSLPNVDATRLARLVEVSRELNSTTNVDDLLKLILNEAAALTGAEVASILLLNPQTRQLHFRTTSGVMPVGMKNMPVPLNNSIAGAVLQANQPLIIDDVTRDPRWHSQVAQAINFETRCILGVPMHDQNRPVGVLESINKNDGHFTEEDVNTLSILADIAGVAVERARLIGELRRANQQLNELDRLKSGFIALASHELRTPLSIILGYVSYLREEAGPQMAGQLDNVLRAAVHLRSLIQDMFNLQYVDGGGANLSRRHCDLASLVRETIAERDEMAMARQQTVTVQIGEGDFPICADKGMIEVILGNLLNNAIKFTPNGGSIKITLERNDSEVWLCVSDSGIGIAEDQLERIFHRFYQVEPHLRRRYEGMGLGLAIVKELVELHEGRIWARSQLGRGSDFYIALPLNAPESPPPN